MPARKYLKAVLAPQQPVVVQSPRQDDYEYANWALSQEERVAEHLQHMHMHMHTQHVQGRVPYGQLEPLPATSARTLYGQGKSLRQNHKDFQSSRTITSADRGKHKKHPRSLSPDRPRSASPALQDIAVNPLRPPSAVGAPVAVWQPSVVTSSGRPSTAPIKSAAGRKDHATGSWSTATSSSGWPFWKQRRGSANITRASHGAMDLPHSNLRAQHDEEVLALGPALVP